jgi:hypothetical protein
MTFTVGWSPFLGPRTRALTNRTFERTPQRLERGRYIATAWSGCFDCHTPHDWTAAGRPLVAGMEGAGEVLPYADLPGRIVAPNLTPDPETGAGRWSDDQLARAIREGVGHDGRALFPMMPYKHYHNMSDEDLASVVVYLRSVPPVHHPLPATEIMFPVKYLIRSAPQPVTAPVADVGSADQLKYGTHLADQAGCSDCHTPKVRGQNAPDMDFAGGSRFVGPWGNVASCEHHARSLRNRLLRRGAFLERHAHRTGQSSQAEPDHAGDGLQESKRLRPQGDLRLPSYHEACEASRGQLGASDRMQALQTETR